MLRNPAMGASGNVARCAAKSSKTIRLYEIFPGAYQDSIR